MAFRWQLQDPDTNWAYDVLHFVSYIIHGAEQGALDGTQLSEAPTLPEMSEALVHPFSSTSTNRMSSSKGKGGIVNDTSSSTITTIFNNVDIDMFYMGSSSIPLGTVTEKKGGVPQQHPYFVVALHGFWVRMPRQTNANAALTAADTKSCRRFRTPCCDTTPCNIWRMFGHSFCFCNFSLSYSSSLILPAS